MMGQLDHSHPPHKVDTTMCQHLKHLVDKSVSANRIQVKEEPGDDQDSSAASNTGNVGSNLLGRRMTDLEKRYTDIVRWGSRSQGVKRRKVSGYRCLILTDSSCPLRTVPLATQLCPGHGLV